LFVYFVCLFCLLFCFVLVVFSLRVFVSFKEKLYIRKREREREKMESSEKRELRQCQCVPVLVVVIRRPPAAALLTVSRLTSTADPSVAESPSNVTLSSVRAW
jgi:hypothetical protein